MKISPIINTMPKNIICRRTEKFVRQNIMQQKDYEISPSYINVLAFKGGMSLSLAQTVEQIDKHGEFPPDIKENALAQINAGNPQAKTLIDIHKNKYSKLNNMETLDEVKEAFPEFRDVLSDKQVSYMPNSFIDDVKKGNNEYFDSDIDLSLQLLQLYWGEGFSLSDLAKKFNGRNIKGTMQRLNIPRVNNHYGMYLKLSDKDYNKRFSDKMSERQKEVARNAIERKEGVYIPHGELSSEHKQKISQGLIKYYSEHPEKVQELSKRQKEFFENNPVEKTKFSQILYRAWGYREAESIKKRLSKFMGRPISPFELSDVSDTNSEVQSKLREFWKKNPWAKEQFSICMKQSWQRQKYLSDLGLVYEPLFEGKVFPDAVISKIKEYIADKFPEVEKDINFYFLAKDPREENFQDTDFAFKAFQRRNSEAEILYEYFNCDNNGSEFADTICFSIDIFLSDWLKHRDKYSKHQNAVFESLYNLYKTEIAAKSMIHKCVSMSDAIYVQSQIIDTAVRNKEPEIARKYCGSIEEAYKYRCENDISKMLARTKLVYDRLKKDLQ